MLSWLLLVGAAALVLAGVAWGAVAVVRLAGSRPSAAASLTATPSVATTQSFAQEPTAPVSPSAHPADAGDGVKEGRIKVVCGSRRGYGLTMSSPEVAPVRCVSFATGKELWRLPVPRTRSYSRDADGSAIATGGVLCQGVESGNMYKLDPNATHDTGSSDNPKILADALPYEPGDADSHAGNLVLEGSPCVIGGRMYVEAGSGHLYGLRLSDLKKVWDFRTGSDLDSTSVATRDGFILAGIEKQYIEGKGGVIKLDPRKPPAQAAVWSCPRATGISPTGTAE